MVKLKRSQIRMQLSESAAMNRSKSAIDSVCPSERSRMLQNAEQCERVTATRWKPSELNPLNLNDSKSNQHQIKFDSQNQFQRLVFPTTRHWERLNPLFECEQFSLKTIQAQKTVQLKKSNTRRV